MNNTMTYQGYTAVIGYEDGTHGEEGVFFGKIIGIRDVINFECTYVEELHQAFHEAVEDYLEYCEEKGVSPQKPYSGTFNVRIPSELHQKISMKAETDGVSMNAWITDAFESKLRLENANS
jgi:predicted HicB family RNase H-like nuclease